MHQKIKEWFNLYGNEIADLKNRGASEVLEPHKTNNLTMSEQARFLVLTGQLDALVWIFHPDDPNDALDFIGEISNLMEQYEKEAELIHSFGIKNIPRGEA